MSLETLERLQQHVGGCREWIPDKMDNCWEPAEYVLWGKLLPPEALGPRCYDHAADHVGHTALVSRANFALINLRDMAQDVADMELVKDLVFALEVICARIKPDADSLSGHESTAYQALLKHPEVVQSRHVQRLMGLE